MRSTERQRVKTLVGFDFVRLASEVTAEEGNSRTKERFPICYAMRATSLEDG